LTLTLDQLEQRTGLVTTGHGGQLTATHALRLAGEADVIPIVIDQRVGVLGHGRSRRIASAAQTPRPRRPRPRTRVPGL
jgi:hypothetical protein